MNGLGVSVNMKSPLSGSGRRCKPVLSRFCVLSCLDQNFQKQGTRENRAAAEHREVKRIFRWKPIVCAALLLPLPGQCAAAELASHAARAVVQRESEEALEAKRFAERLKRHQRRHFTEERREFRRLQARIEKQRRMRKARMKAFQFATARRHAAERALSRQKTRTTRDAGRP